LRAPGKNPYTSPRCESDQAELLSGVFEGKTTGAPISILIPNQDADPSKYESIKHLLRPGHANFTWLEKYGIFDYRGGGRASARETACRVAAGAVAKKLLKYFGIQLVAYIRQIGSINAEIDHENLAALAAATHHSFLFCPDGTAEGDMIALIEQAKREDDSLGGIVEFMAEGLPPGLGDPVYEKLEAKLAQAMLSLPATKGFEIGAGFQSAVMTGSIHNDAFTIENGQVKTKSNHAGGTLGGVSTGMPLVCRIVFKPPASIGKVQETLSIVGEAASLELPTGSRHDPCVAIRAVPVVEAMAALVLADALLLNRCSRLV
jgi:chorismate synthase